MKTQKKIKFNKTLLKNAILFAIFVVMFCLVLCFDFELDFFINQFEYIAQSQLQVYFLDVGQASGTLVIFPNNKSFVVDCGGESTSKKFSDEVSFILHKNGVSKIDYLLLTHSDEDHVGGAIELLERFEVERIFRPKIMSTCDKEIENTFGYKTVYTNIYSRVMDAVLSENAQVDFVNDMTFSEGGATVTFYTCQKNVYSNINSYSPFVHIEYNKKTFLLTGDATAEREREFVNTVGEVYIHFLQVAHHGAKSSTSIDFLNCVKALYAFISAGDDYHPSQEVVNRLKSDGVLEIYNSKEHSLVGVGVKKSGNFYICTFVNSVDYPFVLTLFAIVMFVLMKYNIDNANPPKHRIFWNKKFIRS